MKNFIWTLGGICAAAFGLLIWGSQRSRSIDQLTHTLQDAWADHHTVV